MNDFCEEHGYRERMHMKHIFVVDDEEKIRKLIEAYLKKEGYQVSTYVDGQEALEAFEEEKPDMLIIDIMMPRLNGLELCKNIRKKSDIPIIIVSAKDEELDRILGLELGSDDYLSKPFSPRELVVRVKNLFRRYQHVENTKDEIKKEEYTIKNNMEQEVLTCKNLMLDKRKRNVFIEGKESVFTGKEFELLAMLLKYRSQALHREQILDVVWGYEYIGESRLVDDVVKRIRKKLKDAGSEVAIDTVWGYGYKIQ